MQKNRETTYCPSLWTDIHIDQDGSVYCCCHNKPCVFDNIYEEKLSDIINNKIVQKFREKSLGGKLECFRPCILLDKERLGEPKTTLKIDYPDLSRLQIVFGEACNINCIMCWQDSKRKLSLDVDKLIENVDIAPFKDIEIQGGEPLYIKSAIKFFDYAISQNKKISFYTNGTLMNDVWAEKIARHCKLMQFSINAATKETHEYVNRGSNWEKVLANIQRIRRTREKFDTEVKIRGHMTIVRESIKEIPLFIEKYREFGFDTINFGFDKGVTEYLRLHPVKKYLLKKRINEAINRNEDRSVIDTHRLRLLGLV